MVELLTLEIDDLTDGPAKEDLAKIRAKNGDQQAIKYLEEINKVQEEERKVKEFLDEIAEEKIEVQQEIRQKKYERNIERAPLPEEEFLSFIIADLSLIDNYNLCPEFFSTDDSKKLYKALDRMYRDGYKTASTHKENYIYDVDVPSNFTYSMDQYPQWVGSFYSTEKQQNINARYACLKTNYLKRVCKNLGLTPVGNNIDEIYSNTITDLRDCISRIKDSYYFAKNEINPFGVYDIDKLPRCDEEHPWIIEDVLQEESFTIISGPAKSGKSMFSSQMAYCLQNGLDFIGKHVEQRDVLYVDFEIDTNNIRNRFNKMKNVLGGAGISYKGISAAKKKFDFNDILQEVIDYVAVNESYKVVFWDNFYSMFGGDMNDSSEVKERLNLIRSSVTGVANVVICHNNKADGKSGGNTDPIYAAAGSAAFGNFAEQLISINKRNDGRIVSISGRCMEQMDIACFYGSNTNYLFKPAGLILNRQETTSPESLKEKYPDICEAIGDDGINVKTLLIKFPNETLKSLKEKGFWYSGKHKRNDNVPSDKIFIVPQF